MGSLKNPTFKGGWGFKKNEYRRGRLPKKGGGAWAVC